MKISSHSVNNSSTLAGPTAKEPFIRLSSRAAVFAELAAAEKAASPSSLTKDQLFAAFDNAKADAELRLRQRLRAQGSNAL
ncbi:hypothetical protein PMN64_12535 [Bradyrhizobium sp. UFLA01-814]|uniref:hypothetical protein n=1 Tax=Bradyrhizobium sp. UFLA01-814 TaxID=3023480 RepID=UPI00398AA738